MATAPAGAVSATASLTLVDILDDMGTRAGSVLDQTLPDYADTTPTTDDNLPVLLGTAPAGTVIAITDGGLRIGTTVTDSTGQWHYAVAEPLDNGDHELRAWALTPGGHYNYEDPTQSAGATLRIDAATPLPAGTLDVTGIVDDIGPQQGEVLGRADHYVTQVIDDSQPTLSGTAMPGSTLVIGHQSTPVPVDGSGNWQFTLDTPLPNGWQFVAVQQVGGAGYDNIELNVQAGTLLPPVVTAVTERTGAAVPQGHATTETLPLLQGTSTPGTQVEIYDNGQLIGLATAGADWRWSHAVTTPLADARTHTFTAVTLATADATDRTPSSYGYDIAVGTTARAPLAPVITGLGDDTGPFQGELSGGQGVTDDPRPTLHGTAEPGTRIAVYDNNTLLGEAVADADWLWQLTPASDLGAGLHTFGLMAWSDDRGTSTPGAYTFTVQIGTDALAMRAPVISDIFYEVDGLQGRLPDGGMIDRAPLTLRGSAEPGTRVEVFDNGVSLGLATSSDNGLWQLMTPADLAAGGHVFTAQATWLLDGSVTTDTPRPYFCEVGATGPTLPPPVITGLLDNARATQGAVAAGGTTDDATPTLQGTAPADCIVEVYDNGVRLGQTTAGPDWQWSFTPGTPLATGTHAFTTRATTADGAASSPGTKAAVWTVGQPELTVPHITAVTDDVGLHQGIIPVGLHTQVLTDDPQPTLTGTADPGAVVEVEANDLVTTTRLGFATTDATGHWRLTPATPLVMQTDSFYALKVIARLPDDASAQVADDQISGAPSIAVIPDAAQAHTPVITRIADDTGAVQGTVSRLYGATDDTTPTFTGTGTPGALVWLEAGPANGPPLGEATVGDDGVWTIVPTDALPYGGTAAVDIALFSNSPPGFLPLATTDFVGARLFVTADGAAPSLDTLLATAGLPAGTEAGASPVTSAPTATATAFDAGPAASYSINPIPAELAA